MAEGLIGYKKEDFVDPKLVLGDHAGIDLPADIKFFLKRGKNPSGGIEKKVALYELIREEGGLKLRLSHVGSYLNRIPDEDEIALNFGPSAEGYKWIAKWLNGNGDEVGMQSETIIISEKWRARYEANQRALKTKASEEIAAANAPVAVVHSPAAAAAFGPMEMLAFIREGEERAVKMMERLSVVLKNTEGPSSVMEKAYDAVGRFLEKGMESNMLIARKVAENAKDLIDRSLDEDDEDEKEEAETALPAGPSSGMPAWLEPFMPKIQDGLAHLLGGGPVGAAVKTLIVTSDDWKKIFNDKEKFGEAVEAMKMQFGEEKTEKALNILLNKRPEAKKKK